MAAGAVKCVIGGFGLWAVAKVCFALRGLFTKAVPRELCIREAAKECLPVFFVYFGPGRFVFFSWFASFLDVFFCLLVVRVRASQGAGALFVFSPDPDQRYIWCTCFAMYNQYSVYQNLCRPRFFSCDTPGAICVIMRWCCIFMQ